MQIKLVLDIGGAPAGINRDALVEDIQAELNKLTTTAQTRAANASPQAVPKGAQGDPTIIHWLINLATDPTMSAVYAKALIYALNTILQAAKSKIPPAKKDEAKIATKKDAKEEKPQLKISLPFGEVVLPTTTAVIKAVLKKMGED